MRRQTISSDDARIFQMIRLTFIHIRWLRPEYQHAQNPAGEPLQSAIAIDDAVQGKQGATTGVATPVVANLGATPRQPWPAAPLEALGRVRRQGKYIA